MNDKNLRDLGSVSSNADKALAIKDSLAKNYPLEIFYVSQNNYNGRYNIYTEVVDNEFKIAEFRGFMRGIIVERNWLEP